MGKIEIVAFALMMVSAALGIFGWLRGKAAKTVPSNPVQDAAVKAKTEIEKSREDRAPAVADAHAAAKRRHEDEDSITNPTVEDLRRSLERAQARHKRLKS